MPFPKVEHVKYKKQPLDNVICQIRFPPILKIETEVPANFQDRIKSQYSELSEKQEFIFNLQMRNALKEEIQEPFSSTIKNYEFISDDNIWKLNLTRNFLSLSTKQYTNWEDFKTRFKFAFNNFNDVYQPSLFTRVGLRYTDVIVRSKLDLGTTDWKELINPSLLGILTSPYKDNVLQSESAFEIRLQDNESILRVVTRIVRSADSEEPSFIIDSDFFSTKKSHKENALDKLEYFHASASGLFRWCITEKLHIAMEPEKL